MFGFIKKYFLQKLHFFGCSVLNVNPQKCDSVNNQKSKIRWQIINIDSNEPSFYPYRVKKN